MIGSADQGKDASNPAKKAWPWREAMTPSISHPFFTNLIGSSKGMARHTIGGNERRSANGNVMFAIMLSMMSKRERSRRCFLIREMSRK